MMKHGIMLFLWLVVAGSCVKPYDFNPQSFEKVLVVDGAISDQPGPYAVEITYTYPLDTNLAERVSNAEVWVEAADGDRIEYAGAQDGTYYSPPGFQAEVGDTYQLFIRMPDGATYASTAESLIKSPGIDSVYDRYAELPSSEGDRNVGGIQFFVDTHDETGVARFFRYEWEEAYEIRVPFPAAYELNEDSMLVPMQDEIGVCYRENASNNLIFGTTIGNSENRIAEFPIRFVSQEDQTLRVKYAILVKQYAISESAYLFYKRLRENNESGGSLFDQQTGSVFGNISSLDNNDQQVLGYFEVAGVSEKRTFFSNAELDPRLRVANFPFYCTSENSIKTVPDSVQYYLGQTGGHVYGYSSMPPAAYIHNRSCTDCSFYASITPPDYWE